MTGTVGVVLPAYRPDVEVLAEYIDAIRDRLAPETVRIEVDAATTEVRQALSALPASVNAVPYRRGKGAAITEGFEALSTDVLAFVDADGSTTAASFANVVEAVLNGTVDVAAGSRRHPRSAVATHQTFGRRFLGDAFARVARWFLDVPLHDFQCGAKAMTADGWEAVRRHLYEPGFAWDVELIAVAGALDLSIGEVPIEWHDQPGSTVSPVADAIRLGRALIRARHRAKRLQNESAHEPRSSTREDTVALVDRTE